MARGGRGKSCSFVARVMGVADKRFSAVTRYVVYARIDVIYREARVN